MPLSPGHRLGSYEITAILGAGGMGQVYRARDSKLDRDVAIKILPESFANDPDRLARFEREAKTLAVLNHQNVAHVYDAGRLRVEGATAGQGPDVAYLVMELVEGEDLSATIARGAMPAATTLPIVRQIVDALEAAHESGIVHRDLKPANIKVRTDGAVKVLDFGLAKISEATEGFGGTERRNGAPGASATMTSPAMTGIGVILGTASYMSPEQARGRPVDKRADIWAFGAVWFEMLTGRAPFPGETITDVIAAVVTREPDWTQLPANTPAFVRRLIARCLEKDPKQRLRDIGEVRLALAGEPATADRPAHPSRSRFNSLGWIAAGALLLLLSASIFWPRETPQTSTAPLIKYDIVSPPKSALRLDSRPAVAISPDGGTMVFVATEDGVTKLYLRRRDDVEARPLPGTEGASDPAFSPDGRMLAFAGRTGLMGMPLEGSANFIGKLGDPRGLAWLNDKEIVVSEDTASGLSIVPAGGGPPKPLTTIDVKTDDRSHRWPAAVPGGKAVLFTVGKISSPDNYDDARIDAVIVATGERRKVMEGASFVRVIPGGFLLYAKAGTVFAIPFDSERLVTTGQAVPVLQGVATDTTTGAAHVAFGADGTVVYVPGGTSTIDRQIFWLDKKGVPSLLPLRPGLYNDIRISPDGSRIAVLVGSSGSGDVWIYDTRSTAFTPFTFDQRNATPVWSRDSKSLYYASLETTGAVTTILKRPIDGSRNPEAFGKVPTRGYLDAIDATEKTAFLDQYAFRSAANVDAAMLPLGADKSTILAGGQGNQYGAAISPDGRWVAYSSDEAQRLEVYVRDLRGTGGRWPVSTTGGEEPHWSADGTEIFYRNDTRLMSAKVTTQPEFRSNPPTVLFDGIYNLRSETGVTYDVDHKTGRFLMLRPAGQEAGAPAARVRVIVNWLDELRRAGR
jgi:serine/threonine protein kinase/dipeptidyl aminopeptidase/acylaminoacyl peptidase